jgi:hypothetical protein
MLTEEETQLLNDKSFLVSMNYSLYKRSFSEEFLAKTLEYYDSWICLKTQKHLTPYFCFRYLYDNDTDSADNWTDYNDIVKYFVGSPYSEEELQKIFQEVMNETTIKGNMS